MGLISIWAYDLTLENVYFLSRPRRFEKFLLLSILEVCFSAWKELYAGLKMEAQESDCLKVRLVFRCQRDCGKVNRAAVCRVSDRDRRGFK